MKMVNLNEITVTGKLTHNPEIRYFKNKKDIEVAVTTLRINFRDKRNTSKSYYINVEVFGKSAIRICETCTKGSVVFIKGYLRRVSYEGSDGTLRYKSDIVVSNIREVKGLYINSVEISGFLTKKPDLKTITTKKGEHLDIATASIGFKDPYNYNNSFFINLVVFDNAKYFHEKMDKGTPLYLKGNLKNRVYKTKDNQTRTFLELIVEEFQKIYMEPTSEKNENKPVNLNNLDDIEKENLNDFVFVDEDDLPF